MKAAQYYLFGASTDGINRYHELKNHYNIAGFIDNDKKKWNKVIVDGKKAISVSELNNTEVDCHIFITSQYAFEISVQLDELNVENYSFYPSLEYSVEPGYTNKNLRQKIDLCAETLFKKLNSINIDTLEISDYNKKYLSSKTWSEIFKYSRIMYAVLSKNSNIRNFLDYGGGTGLLSLLAIECGLPNVYYNDIYDLSNKDAYVIASALGYLRTDYIEGDIEQVIDYSKKTNVIFDAVASYDVLEHIYDLESYFDKLKIILSNECIVCMETVANPYNKEYYEGAVLGHLKVEYLNREYEYGHKKRDSLTAYFDLRYNAIHAYNKLHNLNFSELECVGLAFLTKGMIKNDIEEAINNYLETGELPAPDPIGIFKHNTCDPLTGNWKEHLIDFDKLEKILRNLNYEIEINFSGKKEFSLTLQLILTR